MFTELAGEVPAILGRLLRRRVEEEQGVRLGLRMEVLHPDLERLSNVRSEHPAPGVIGLVVAEPLGAVSKVDPVDMDRQGLRRPPSPLTGEQPVEDAVDQRHVRARQELRVLVRV